MNAVIPDALQVFVMSRVAEGGFASVDEYVGYLVQADLQRSTESSLEQELLRGLQGQRVKVTSEEFESLRQSLRDRAAGDRA